MLCPTDILVDLAANAYRRGNYAANTGIGPLHSLTTSKDPSRISGPFTMNSNTNFRDFRDGQTSTVIATELLKVPANDLRGVMHYPEGPLYMHDRTPNTSVPDDFRASHCVSTVDAPCVGAYTGFNDRAIVLSARSLHEGGVHILMGDGGVRFVTENINGQVWRDIGTMDKGELIGEF